LKGEPHTIVGVLPEDATTLDADVYTALQPGREGEGQAANFVTLMRVRAVATGRCRLHHALIGAGASRVLLAPIPAHG
jgi:hypothetical protein